MDEQSKPIESTENYINKNTVITEERITVPVIQEFLKIDKKVVETGKVFISKTVHEEVEKFTLPSSEEHISVERIAKNEFVNEAPPAVRYEGEVMIIPVLKEVAVVEKRIMLVEELRVTKFKTEKTESHEVTLRKEAIEVQHTPPNTPPSV